MSSPLPEAYVIQPARPEHLPALAAIERAAADLFPAGSIPAHCRLVTVAPEVIDKAQKDGNLMVAVEKVSNSPVGFALLRMVEGLALLAELDVLPEHGRQGLGRSLVQAAARQAAKLGHDRLYLTTFEHVPWNGPFYARLDFVFLAPEQTPRPIQDILVWERALGMERRVAMRLDVSQYSPARAAHR